MPKAAKAKPIPPPARSQPAWLREVLPLLLLAALTVIVYANSLHGEFVFDDQAVIMQNPAIVNVHTLGDVVRAAGGWRQMLFLSYAFNYYWGGMATFSYHIVNLLLHLLNVFLIYFIILEIGGREAGSYAALAGAAVFSTHTLLSSAVSYIAGRSSVLCAVFYFVAILCFLKFLSPEASVRKRAICLSLTGIAAFLAWQTKQDAITLPVFLAFVLWLYSGQEKRKYVTLLALLPFVAVFFMRKELAGLYSSVGSNQILVNAGFDRVLPAGTYFRSYITAIADYLLPRFVFPASLNADPAIAAIPHWYSPEFIFSAVVLLVLAFALWRAAKSNRLLALGLGALLFSPLTAYALFPLADVVLEHRAYIPGLSIALVAAALFSWIRQHYPALKIAVPAAVVVILAGMTIARNPVFADNIALWQNAVSKSPDKARAHFDLGAAYQNAQRPLDALAEYEKTIRLKPDVYAAYSNVAAIELDHGRLDQAEQTLLDVTRLAPDYTDGFINLAVLYLRRQNPDKALEALKRALETNPDSFAAYFNQGEAFTLKGDFNDAIESYKRAIHLRPDIQNFRLSLGNAYMRAGDVQAAEEQFKELASTSSAADALRSLASLYSERGDSAKGIEYLKESLQMKPINPDAHDDLGVLYFKQKDYAEAAREFESSIQQRPGSGATVLNLAAAQQLSGNVAAARQTLQRFLQQYGAGASPYVDQARNRLDTLK